jgi:hypothetical protein
MLYSHAYAIQVMTLAVPMANPTVLPVNWGLHLC